MARKKTQRQHTVAITGLSHEGRGIAHIDGKATFVFNALPDEVVKIQLDKTRGAHNEAHTIEIIEPSNQRHNPPCEYFGTCGGCSLQHMSTDDQINHKQNTLKERFEHQAHVPKQWHPPITASSQGYRRKARLSVKYVPGKNRVLVGFRERNGRYVANMEYCHILHPSVGKILDKISILIEKTSIKTAIPQIEVAIGDNHTALVFRHLAAFNQDDLTLLTEFAQLHNLHLYLQPGKADSIHPLYPKTPKTLSYMLPNHKLSFEFKPNQFTQVNADINQQMIDQAIEFLALQPGDKVLDLFCGIGNFSLPIARYCQQVNGVEGDLGSIEQAKHNASLNNIQHCEFYCANLFENDYNNQQWAQQQYDKILLDPPRAGAKEIISLIPKWNPQRIVYISCNPATLVRDTAMLIEQGYIVETSGVMDMFPHTQHVEAITLFTKSPCNTKKKNSPP